MKQIYKYFTLLAVVLTIGIGNVWGDTDFSHTYTYSEKGTGTGKTWDVTNADDASTYWKVPSTTSDPSVAIVSGIFKNKDITSNVVITLDIATYGGGDDPTSSKFAIYNSSACTSQITATQGGTLPSSSTYTTATYTITKANAIAGFTKDLAIKIASGTKQIRLRSFTVAFTYTDKVIEPYTVRFYKTDGTYQDITEASAEAGVTPPTMQETCEDWEFQGWSTTESEDDENTDELSTVTLTTGKYYPTANTTLYPVYTTSGGIEFSEYQLITSATGDLSGQYLLSTGSVTATGAVVSSKALPYESLTPGTTEYAAKEFTIVKNGSSSNYFIKFPNGYYLGNSNNSTDLKSNNSTTAPTTDVNHFLWTFTTSTITNVNNDTRQLMYNSSGSVIKCYASSNTYPKLKLYKRIETEITYYYSYPTCCEELGSIGGTVEFTDPTTAVLTWDKLSNVAASDPYAISYRTGSDDYGTTNVGAVDLTGAKATCTITGLSCNTDYDFKIAVTAASDYCDKDTVLSNKNSGKFAITLTGSGSVTGGLFTVTDGDDEIDEACDATSLELTALAEDGYSFSNWEITHTTGGADAWDDVEDTGNADDGNIIIAMPAYDITVNAVFECVTPTFTVHPASKTDYSTTDSPTALGYTASAAGASLTQQWQISSDNENWADIDGATSATYTPTISTAGTKYYRVIVTNAASGCSTYETSNAATITSVTPSVCKTPTFSVDEGTYRTSKSVSLSCGTDGATIYYTTNGDDPDEGSTEFDPLSPISVTVTTTIKAIAIKDGLTESSIASATYTIKCADPAFNKGTGIYDGSQSITLSSDYCTYIYYTTDNTTPSTSSTKYTGAITVDESMTIKAIAWKDGCSNSDVVSADYTIQYSLSWSANGGDDLTGDYTSGKLEYGDVITAPSTPTRTGYSFTGWHNGTSVVTPVTTMPKSNITYTAQWSINSYNISVANNDKVTITATPASESAIAEGSNADVNYGKTVTLSYSSLSSDANWGGWRVYKSGDASTTVDVSGTGNGATFTLPAYAVVVSAYVYSDMIAWCDPDINIDGDVHITSYKDIYVQDTTKLVNMSSTDLGSATSMDIVYLDGNDNEVAKASSLFRLCYDGTSSKAEVDASSSTIDISASHTLDNNYSIKYTPSAFEQLDNGKLQIVLKRGDKTLKTVTHELHGRSLPEEFVIAVKNKNDDKWYALPDTLTSDKGAIVPTEILVDNTTTPTKALVASSHTVYKGKTRNSADGYISGIRLTTTGNNYLRGIDSNTKVYLQTTNSDANQVWYLQSSDFGAYTIKRSAAVTGKTLGLYQNSSVDYFGYAATPHSAGIYLLPIDTKSSPVEATVSEWSRHDALVVVDVSEIEATQVDGKLGEDESDALFTLGDAVAENTYLVRLSDDIDLSGKSGESLTLRWYDSSDELVGASTVVIPSIIGTSSEDNWSELATTPTIEDIVVVEGDIVVDEVAKAKRVIIDQLSGDGKLTINAAKALIVEETVRKLNSENFVATEVADLHIGSSSTGNGSLVMGSHDGTNEAQVDFYTKARKTAENNWVNQYIGTPFNVADGRGVKEDYYGSYLYSFNFSNQSWDNIKDEDYHFTPFLGYNIIRKDADAATLEMQGTLVATTNQSPTVYFKTDKAHSENVLANSWTAPIKIANFDATPSTGDFTNVEATIYIFNAGGAADAADDMTLAGQYSTYSVGTAGSAVIPSMQSFSVYATAAAPSLTLNYARLVYNPAVAGIAVQPNYAPHRMKAAAVSEEMQPIRLRVSGESGYADELKIYLHEDFSDAFENGWDAHKMYGYPETPQLYAVTDDGELAILCAPDADATLLGFKAGEADTEYTFTFRYDSDEPLYLLDMQNNTYTEVQTGNAYTFQTSDVGAHNRFVLTRFAPQMPTDIEPTSDSSLKGREAATKHIIDNRIYILLRGVLYDATGKRVRVTNERVNE